MDQKHRNLIRKNLDQLVEKTHDIRDIVDILKEKGILNDYQARIILKKFPDHKRQVTEFYGMIQGRGPNAFAALENALRETNNLSAFDILRSLSVSYSSTPPAENINSHMKLVNLIKNPESANRISTYKKLVKVDVKVHPQREFMDVDAKNQPCGTFRMRSHPRGYALIINIWTTEGMTERAGSEVDVANLEQLFDQLGYKFTTFSDLSKKEMKNRIVTFAKDKKLSQVDSCVVFIMSHGVQPESTEHVQLITADGDNLQIRWILDQFTRNNSPLTTSGEERKPKMFFFQACRKDEKKSRTDEEKFSARNKTSKLDTDSQVTSNSLIARDLEDTLVVHSTAWGHYSMRDTSKGTWFVDDFCRIVAENAWRYDLETMLGMVDNELKKKKDRDAGTQTIDVKKVGLSKKIYFNPGL